MRATQGGILPVFVFALSAASCGDGPSVDPDGQSQDGRVDGGYAFGDASPLDCAADYPETYESHNDRVVDETGDVEMTNLVLEDGGELTICGQIDPAQLTRDIVDADVYAFEVKGSIDVRLELEAPAGPNLRGFEVSIYSPEGPTFLASGPYYGNHGVLTRHLGAGTYWVSVVARSPAPADPAAYALRITAAEPPCPSIEGPASHAESSDGADDRGNDTIAVHYSAQPPFSATPDDDDAPEPTSLVLGSGESHLISGDSGDVEGLDDYFDRDTYAIHTGAEVDEVSIRLSWDHDAGVDLDLFLFPAGDLGTDLTAGGASSSGASDDEVVTVAVEPGSELWLWVGAFAAAELPAEYDVSICGTSYATR